MEAPQFDQPGTFRTLVTGRGDPITTTMNFRAVFPDGNSFRATHRFVDDDHAGASSKTTNPAGKTIMSRSWKQTRRKE